MTTRHSATHPERRPGFTLMELLVVISIIALLIGLLGVAFSGALATSKKAATESLMRNIQTGLEQFHTDFGYYPPLIDGKKDTLESRKKSPQTNDQFRQELKDHRYYSPYSLTVYLLGVGQLAPYDQQAEMDNPARDDGVEGPGFRDPGPDHSWGGAIDRMDHRAPASGRVFGPYIDIGDGEGILRRVEARDFPWSLPLQTGATLDDFFANENTMDDSGPSDPNRKGDLFVLTDRWDNPFRYYKGWPTRELDNNTPKPSLDLVPAELRTHESLLQSLLQPRPGAVRSDPQLDPALMRAPYALLSGGPDADFGDTDADGKWLDSEMFFNNSTTAMAVIDRIDDNIRTTP